MVTYYTGIGQYSVERNKTGQNYPIVVLSGKECQLTIVEMILWTKCNWNICSLDFLRDSFACEEKILGNMNFEFILNRLIQRGLIITASAESESEALHALIDNLIVTPVDLSFTAKIKAFLTLIFALKVSFSTAKKVFCDLNLTKNEDNYLHWAKRSQRTVKEIAALIDIDDHEFLTLSANLYSSKLISFSEKDRS